MAGRAGRVRLHPVTAAEVCRRTRDGLGVANPLLLVVLADFPTRQARGLPGAVTDEGADRVAYPPPPHTHTPRPAQEPAPRPSARSDDIERAPVAAEGRARPTSWAVKRFVYSHTESNQRLALVHTPRTRGSRPHPTSRADRAHTAHDSLEQTNAAEEQRAVRAETHEATDDARTRRASRGEI